MARAIVAIAVSTRCTGCHGDSALHVPEAQVKFLVQDRRAMVQSSSPRCALYPAAGDLMARSYWAGRPIFGWHRSPRSAPLPFGTARQSRRQRAIVRFTAELRQSWLSRRNLDVRRRQNAARAQARYATICSMPNWRPHGYRMLAERINKATPRCGTGFVEYGCLVGPAKALIRSG
jgi:hypothetical protein